MVIHSQSADNVVWRETSLFKQLRFGLDRYSRRRQKHQQRITFGEEFIRNGAKMGASIRCASLGECVSDKLDNFKGKTQLSHI